MQLQELVDRIRRLPAPTLVCIDGPAGAGKTTVAGHLADALGAQVVHMDDLYDGWDNAFDQDITAELRDIVNAFKAGSPVQHRVYDWGQGQFHAERASLPRTDILIIEGVGAAQPEVRDCAELRVFVDVAADIGDARVLARDGEEIAGHMSAWRLREAQYFTEDNTAARCEVHLSGSESWID